MGVVQHGLRPQPPPMTPPALVDIMQRCWHKNPSQRPPFVELVPLLDNLHKALREAETAPLTDSVDSRTAPAGGGFFSKLRGAASKPASG